MRKKVRFLLAGLLVADVLLIGYLMYDYIQNKIPDSVLTYVGEKQELDLPAFFKTEQSVPALHVQNQDGSFSMKSTHWPKNALLSDTSYSSLEPFITI